MPTSIEISSRGWSDLRDHRRVRPSARVLTALIALSGCGGEPSQRELENRRELEALLTAVSLHNQKELDRDIQRIEGRHQSGTLSDRSYESLHEIIKKAQTGDWAGAEKQAYALREATPFFQ